jgi:hypothetical protein
MIGLASAVTKRVVAPGRPVFARGAERVADRHASGGGPGGRQGTYYVRDDETGTTYSFSDADIVTEEFRTIRTGERVRFLTDPADSVRAVYVIRLDLPDLEAFY